MHLFTKIADNVWETFNNYECNNFVHLFWRYLMAITKLIMYVTYIFKESIRACKYSEFYIWNVNSSWKYFHQKQPQLILILTIRCLWLIIKECRERNIDLLHTWNIHLKNFMTQQIILQIYKKFDTTFMQIKIAL